MKHRILIALLVIIFAFTACSPDGNTPEIITDPLKDAVRKKEIMLNSQLRN